MEETKKHSLHAWILAARPKTLAGAIVPVWLGASLAWADGEFVFLPALLCALFACGMQISANFINDLYDYRKGTDRTDRLGPPRACAQGWINPSEMQRGIAVSLILSSLAGCGLLPYGGWELLIAGVTCIAAAFLYTTRFSYLGLGDILVVVFFGFVPVCGTYYVQTQTITADVLLVSLICGLSTNTLLVINNYRDREQDAISGKKTLVVRFGEPFGRYFYLVLGVLAVLLSLLFSNDWHDIRSYLPCVYLLLHIRTWRTMSAIRSGKRLNTILGKTALNILLLGVLLGIGILMQK